MSQFVVDSPQRDAGEWLIQRDTGQCLALITALTIVLSATGACDTDNLGLIHRTSLWLVVSALVVGQAVLLHRQLADHVSHGGLRGVLASAATVVLTTVQLHFLKYTPFLPKEPDPPLEFLLFMLPLAGPVALLALTLVHGYSERPNAGERASLRDDNASKADPWPTAEVVRVTAQDHYLCVHTREGTQLIRGRMKDALSKLAADHGMQIHRSHWVANGQIVRIVRTGRDYRAVLSNGDALPIGRSRVAAVRAFLMSL